MLPSIYEAVAEVESANWWADVLSGGDCISALLPPGFESYAVVEPVHRTEEYPRSLIQRLPVNGLSDGAWNSENSYPCGIWCGYAVAPPTESKSFQASLGERYWLFKVQAFELVNWRPSRDNLKNYGCLPNLLWPGNRTWAVVAPHNSDSVFVCADQRRISRLKERVDLRVREVQLRENLGGVSVETGKRPARKMGQVPPPWQGRADRGSALDWTMNETERTSHLIDLCANASEQSDTSESDTETRQVVVATDHLSAWEKDHLRTDSSAVDSGVLEYLVRLEAPCRTWSRSGEMELRARAFGRGWFNWNGPAPPPPDMEWHLYLFLHDGPMGWVEGKWQSPAGIARFKQSDTFVSWSPETISRFEESTQHAEVRMSCRRASGTERSICAYAALVVRLPLPHMIEGSPLIAVCRRSSVPA